MTTHNKTENCFFQDRLSLIAGQKHCGMFQGEHSAILLTFIKLLFVIKIFVLSIFEWHFYTDFTLSVTSHINCIVARCLINVVYLTACCLNQVMMTLYFLNDVANDVESTQNKK